MPDLVWLCDTAKLSLMAWSFANVFAVDLRIMQLHHHAQFSSHRRTHVRSVSSIFSSS
jgi:hypothetical protein